MSFDLHIQIDDKSPEGLALKTIVSRDRVSPEEAVKRSLTFLAALSDPDNFDHLFTPRKIAEIRAAEEEASTGNNLTVEQVRQNFKAKHQAWLQNHPA